MNNTRSQRRSSPSRERDSYGRSIDQRNWQNVNERNNDYARYQQGRSSRRREVPDRDPQRRFPSQQNERRNRERYNYEESSGRDPRNNYHPSEYGVSSPRRGSEYAKENYERNYGRGYTGGRSSRFGNAEQERYSRERPSDSFSDREESNDQYWNQERAPRNNEYHQYDGDRNSRAWYEARERNPSQRFSSQYEDEGRYTDNDSEWEYEGRYEGEENER